MHRAGCGECVLWDGDRRGDDDKITRDDVTIVLQACSWAVHRIGEISSTESLQDSLQGRLMEDGAKCGTRKPQTILVDPLLTQASMQLCPRDLLPLTSPLAAVR